jgi:hypothetical protein
MKKRYYSFKALAVRHFIHCYGDRFYCSYPELIPETVGSTWHEPAGRGCLFSPENFPTNDASDLIPKGRADIDYR